MCLTSSKTVKKPEKKKDAHCPHTYRRCIGKNDVTQELASPWPSSKVSRGRASRHAGASESCRRKREGESRDRRGCERTTITQAACGFQPAAKTSHSLRPRLSPELSNPPVPPHSHSRPHTNGLNKRSA